MTDRLTPPPIGAEHSSTPFQTWYSLITRYINQLLLSGGGVSNLDGGSAGSIYGGTTGIDGGGA